MSRLTEVTLFDSRDFPGFENQYFIFLKFKYDTLPQLNYTNGTKLQFRSITWDYNNSSRKWVFYWNLWKNHSTILYYLMIRGREAIYLVLIDDTPNAFHDNDDHVTKNPAWAGLRHHYGDSICSRGEKMAKIISSTVNY